MSPCVKSKALSDPLVGNYLLATSAVLSELLLMASAAVEIVPFGQETLRTDWLLALKAGEALLMPHFVLILYILRP